MKRTSFRVAPIINDVMPLSCPQKLFDDQTSSMMPVEEVTADGILFQLASPSSRAPLAQVILLSQQDLMLVH